MECQHMKAFPMEESLLTSTLAFLIDRICMSSSRLQMSSLLRSLDSLLGTGRNTSVRSLGVHTIGLRLFSLGNPNPALQIIDIDFVNPSIVRMLTTRNDKLSTGH